MTGAVVDPRSPSRVLSLARRMSQHADSELDRLESGKILISTACAWGDDGRAPEKHVNLLRRCAWHALSARPGLMRSVAQITELHYRLTVSKRNSTSCCSISFSV